MKEIIDKYKREPIAIAVVVGIVIYILYLLVSPYQRCMSTAPEKYRLHSSTGEKIVTDDWHRFQSFCIKNTSY
jgi:hypothetical protein